MEENENFIPIETAAGTFQRTVVNPEADQSTKGREWQAIRDECQSGGALDERCNLVAAGEGHVKLDVVAKKLSCGCWLVPVDADDDGGILL